MTAVIEKPMLFSGPMILRLLAGSKTQTRRTVFKPNFSKFGQYYELRGSHDCIPNRVVFDLERRCKEWPLLPPSFGVNCPHPVGSRVWVRETWQAYQPLGDYPLEGPCYRSTGHAPTCKLANHLWRPSIFMPRKFSRITLEITAVRVERLQDISFADCRAEGCSEDWSIAAGECQDRTCEGVHRGEKWHYQHIWESINGKGSWALNPFVWVYEFKRIKP